MTSTLATAHRRSMSGLAVLGVVVGTRFLIAVLWRLRGWEAGDTYYYFQRVTELSTRGIGATLTEYPVPVVWLLQIPTWAGDTMNTYLGAFALQMIAFDLAFCALLWTRGGRRRGQAIAYWSLFLLALGPLMWLRFDILPAVLVGAAAVFATTRPAVAGALLAVGAGVKLWPGSLLALLLHRRTRLRALGGFLVTGAALLLATIGLAGTTRVLSPLEWQGGRGLQVESVWATPLMLARLGDGGTWSVQFSRWQAFEVFGPGVALWLAVASMATVLGMVACLALTWRTVTASRPDGPALAAAMLSVVAIIVLTNKTLSPQYIGWLGAPLAALVARVGLDGRTRHSVAPATVRRWAAQVLLIAVLSQVIYPWLYDALVGLAPDSPFKTTVALCLALRNLLIVTLAVDTFWGAWRALGVRVTAVPVQRPVGVQDGPGHAAPPPGPRTSAGPR